MFTGSDISAGLGPALLRPLSSQELSRSFAHVVVDSRQVSPGDLFIALRGERHDGHAFIADALERGAAGVLARSLPEDLPPQVRAQAALFPVDDPLAALHTLAASWRDRSSARVIGVTGSVGKTSTKEAIAGLLAQRYCVLKSTGNLNTEIGLPLVLLELTPAHQRMVLEMGMYDQGDITLLCRLARPSVGVVTNIGPSHLERLGSMERITDAKAELVESLPQDGVAILNADDDRVTGLAQRTCARVTSYGLSEQAHCRAKQVESYGLEGIGFRLVWEGQTRQVRTPLLGRHSVYTALAAAAVALTEGLSMDEVAHGLEGLQEANRMRVCRTSRGATVLDDTYNASPASVEAALRLLAELPGRRIAVLGDMLELGSYEEPGHRAVGRCATASVDILYTIGPRARLVAEAAREQGLAAVTHWESREEAARSLSSLLRDGDYVLVKGSRGMALEELVAALGAG